MNEPSCGRCRLRRLKTQHRIHVTNHNSNLLLQCPACLFPVINRHLIPLVVPPLPPLGSVPTLTGRG